MLHDVFCRPERQPGRAEHVVDRQPNPANYRNRAGLFFGASRHQLAPRTLEVGEVLLGGSVRTVLSRPSQPGGAEPEAKERVMVSYSVGRFSAPTEFCCSEQHRRSSCHNSLSTFQGSVSVSMQEPLWSKGFRLFRPDVGWLLVEVRWRAHRM